MHKKWHALMRANHAAAHGDKLEVRDEERAQEIRRLLADDAFGKISDDNAAIASSRTTGRTSATSAR